MPEESPPEFEDAEAPGDEDPEQREVEQQEREGGGPRREPVEERAPGGRGRREIRGAAGLARAAAWGAKHAVPLYCGEFGVYRKVDDLSDSELVRCWYNDDNFKRLERVHALAQKRGALPINVALAYVLALPLPLFALIGPRTLHELQSALPALELELTPKELRWLNLE